MKDLLICFIIIISIKIAERFFPNNFFVYVLICTIGIIYFGKKIWKKLKNNSIIDNIEYQEEDLKK